MDLPSIALGVATGAAAAHSLAHLREHRTEPGGVADLLNWGFMVDDGVILQKDGSLVGGWTYRGPDLGAATANEMNTLSRHLNDALLPVGDDWMLHVDAIRRPATAYAPSRFPDPVTQIIDDERRAAYETQASRQYETEYMLVATHLPPPDAYSRVSAFFVQGGASSRIDWVQVLDTFAVALHTIENRLSGRLKLERMGSDRLLTHLHECLTGRDHPVRPAEGKGQRVEKVERSSLRLVWVALHRDRANRHLADSRLEPANELLIGQNRVEIRAV
jgi:type IV secretion system protein VirB4